MLYIMVTKYNKDINNVTVIVILLYNTEKNIKDCIIILYSINNI